MTLWTLQDSTFGGNDSIVAFSRLYNATVAIHQLNEPLWQVKCESGKDANQPKDQMEIHISYHNGDHYNSVRRADEDRQSISPAKVKLKVSSGLRKRWSTKSEQLTLGWREWSEIPIHWWILKSWRRGQGRGFSPQSLAAFRYFYTPWCLRHFQVNLLKAWRIMCFFRRYSRCMSCHGGTWIEWF